LSLFCEQKSNQKTLSLAELIPARSSPSLKQQPADKVFFIKPSALPIKIVYKLLIEAAPKD
jgi:hypothetical protein